MKKLFAIFTIAVLAAVCFTGCGKKAGTDKLEYSDVTGLWGTEEGDMTVSFNDNKTGNVSSVTGDTVDNTEFTYVINYDEESEKSSIIIMTEDDYSETYTAELDDNILTLTLYDTETGSDAVTKLIKGQKLVMPEDSTDSDENKIEATTSVAVPAEEKAEDTTLEADLINKESAESIEADEVSLVDIVDLTEVNHMVTAAALEEFYKDTEYTYYFPSIKSEYIECRFTNGTTMKFLEALETEKVKVSDLDTYGIMYWKVDKEGNYVNSLEK